MRISIFCLAVGLTVDLDHKAFASIDTFASLPQSAGHSQASAVWSYPVGPSLPDFSVEPPAAEDIEWAVSQFLFLRGDFETDEDYRYPHICAILEATAEETHCELIREYSRLLHESRPLYHPPFRFSLELTPSPQDEDEKEFYRSYDMKRQAALEEITETLKALTIARWWFEHCKKSAQGLQDGAQGAADDADAMDTVPSSPQLFSQAPMSP